MTKNKLDSNAFCLSEHMQGCPQDASSEESLIVAAQAGMPGAMDELLVRHRGAMFRAARRFTSNHADAEDLVQDAMLRAFINIGRFRKESRFATWLSAIVKNAALSMKRKKRVACWISMDDSKQEGYVSPRWTPRWDFPDSRLSPEQEIIRQEWLHILKSAVSAQSQERQIVLRTCVFNEQPIRAASAVLGITVGATKSHLYRARRGLSDSFVKRGYMKRRVIPAVGCERNQTENPSMILFE